MPVRSLSRKMRVGAIQTHLHEFCGCSGIFTSTHMYQFAIKQKSRHPAHPPNHQEQEPTHLSKHAKAHDEVRLSALSLKTHMIVCRQQRCQPSESSAQRERGTEIGNANIEDSEIEREKAVGKSCGLCRCAWNRSDAWLCYIAACECQEIDQTSAVCLATQSVCSISTI